MCIRDRFGAWVQQIGIATVKNKFNDAVAAGVGAITNTTTATLDKRGTTASEDNTINADMLLQAAALMGDHFEDIRTWLMHSQSWFKFARNNLKDYQRLFNYRGVTVMEDTLGNQFIITDDNSLQFSHQSQVKYRTLGLLEGAIKVYDDGEMYNNIDTRNRTRIQTTLKTESRFALRVRGYSFGTQKYPTIAQLQTSTAWTKTANTDNADGPGVALLHQV